MLTSRLALSASAILALVSAENDISAQYKVDAQTLEKEIPTPLSDHTATLVGGKVYITGGCNDPNGNSWYAPDGAFYCGSISNKTFAFDLETKTFETLADMPEERYRHAAAEAGGYLWVHGGRSLFDDLMTDTLAYDIEKNTWKSFTGVPETYHVSDNTGFSNGNYAYFTGGYADPNYTAVALTFRIDATTTDFTSDVPNIEARASLNLERGDVAGAAESTYAVVAGGFTHNNGFCEPHVQAELYDFEKDTWTFISNMTYARGDKAVVSLEDHIYALGGERQVVGHCDLDVLPEPGERTIVIDKVERYNVDDDSWATLADLPDGHRFRFAGVGYNGKIYTFGGQDRYNLACNCYKTSNDVTVYEEVEIGSGAVMNVVASLLALATLVTSSLFL